MDLLCIAAEAQPTGYVLVNGSTLTTTDLARLTGAPEADVQSALAELDAAGVFSRDRAGRIYSRRMVREAKTSAINRKNGKMGGNPNLCDETIKSPPVKGPDNPGVKPQYPIANKNLERSKSTGSKTRAGARASPRRGHLKGEDRKSVWFSSTMIPYINERFMPDKAASLIQGWLEDQPRAIRCVNDLDDERKRRMNGAIA